MGGNSTSRSIFALQHLPAVVANHSRLDSL